MSDRKFKQIHLILTDNDGSKHDLDVWVNDQFEEHAVVTFDGTRVVPDSEQVERTP